MKERGERRKKEEKIILLFTEVAHHSPVRLGHSEPLTVSGSDVDVDGTEVVVLLVTWRDKVETPH